MTNEPKERESDPDSSLEDDLEVLKPGFGEMFQKLHHDVGILFPDASPDGRMIAAVGALISMKIDTAVVALKSPTKVVKLGPGGVIVSGR